MGRNSIAQAEGLGHRSIDRTKALKGRNLRCGGVIAVSPFQGCAASWCPYPGLRRLTPASPWAIEFRPFGARASASMTPTTSEHGHDEHGHDEHVLDVHETTC